MGRQAHLTRLVLGRSAYEPLPSSEGTTQATQNSIQNEEPYAESGREPNAQVDAALYRQQYDSRGYPQNLASRARNSQSRRAMNDVLTTVGLCINVNANVERIRSSMHNDMLSNTERTKIDAVMSENEAGIFVAFTESVFAPLAGICTLGLRQRLQTFRFYSTIPLTRVIRSEYVHFGVLRALFAGGPAHVTFSFFDFCRPIVINHLSRDIAARLGSYVESEETRERVWLTVAIAGKMLSAMTVILLAPLDIFATLQRLGLLPAWTLPHPRAFVPLSPSSPFRMPYLPKGLDIRSLLGFMSSVIISPLALTSIMWWARPLVEKKLRKYIRACLPKPNFPDKYSLLGAEEDGLDHRDIPGLGNAVDTPEYWESMSLLEELSKDLQSIGRNFQFFCNLWRSLVHLKPTRSRFSASNQGADSRILGSRRTTVTGVANQPPIGVDHPQDGVRQIPLPTVRVPSETPASSVPNLPREASSSSPSRPSTPRLPIELTGTNVSSRHVQLNGPFTLPGLATPSQSTLRVQILYDHITTLTTYPANSMASSLATRLTTILLLPLEALFVRSVARAFLSSPAASAGAQAAAMRWKSEVYPLGGWFGSGLQGGWRGMGDYVSKMVLVQGLEMGIQAAVWQVCVGMGWFIGRKWYGWGK